MTAAASYAGAAFGMFKRDVLMFASYRFRLVSPILTAIFTVTLFHYISRLVSAEAVGTADRYYAFVVVGIMIVGVLNSTLVTPPIAMRQELVAGTFERLVLSPFGPVRAIISMMIFPLTVALLVSAVTLAFAALAFGLSVEWSTAPLAIPVAILGALAFAPFGLVIMSGVLIAKQANAGASWVVAGIALIAGVYFPVTLLPSWVQWASDVQPFTPAVELLRSLLVAEPLSQPAWLELIKLAAFAAVLFPAGTLLLRRAVRVSQRRGTIIEY